MVHTFIIKRIPRTDYQGLEFPDELQQKFVQFKENLMNKFNLSFESTNYISEDRDYRSLEFSAEPILLEIIASDNTRYYEVLIKHNLYSWQGYLIEALEANFDVYSREEFIGKCKK